MQLKEALCVTIPATLSAWYASSRSPHELARDLLRQQRRAPRHALGALRAGRAPHDEVVRLVGAGDVHLVDGGVVREVGALVAAAVDDPQEPAGDRVGERLLQERPHVRVHRVHLEEADLPLVEELRDDVGGRDRVHVPGAEHEADLAVVIRRLVEAGARRVQLRLAQALLQVHVSADAEEEDAVQPVRGEDAHRQPAVGGLGGRADGRVAVPLQHHERADRLAQDAEHGVGRGDPLVACGGRVGGEPLRGAAGERGALRHARGAGQHLPP
jgi:hypothetical protein